MFLLALCWVCAGVNLQVPHRSTIWLRSATLSLLRAFIKNSMLKYWQPRKHSNLPNSYNGFTQWKFVREKSIKCQHWPHTKGVCAYLSLRIFHTFVPFSFWSMHKSSHLLVNFCCKFSCSAFTRSKIRCRFIKINRYRRILSIFGYSAHFALNVTQRYENLSTGEKKSIVLLRKIDKTAQMALLRDWSSFRILFEIFHTSNRPFLHSWFTFLGILTFF